MVAHLLSLKWRLLLNGFRRSPWQIVGIVAGALYAAGLVLSAVVGLVALRWADPQTAQTVVVLGGALAVTGWAVIPLVTSAADLTLDPSRFATSAIPIRDLLPGLALAGLLGLPGIATLIAALGTVATWSRGFVPAAGALVGAVLGVLSCVVASKVVTTAVSSLLSSRRFKDISSILFVIPLVLAGPIVTAVVGGVGDSRDYLPELAAVVSWTPLGAAWSLGGELDAGNAAAAGVKLLIALASLAVLGSAWYLLLGRAMVTPAYAGGGSGKAGKAGLFGIFPATPAGAVAARSLTYWMRDPRYAGSLVVVPLLPVLFYFIGSQNGNQDLLIVVAPMTAFLLAWSISADVSYDNTAFALHLATGVRGRDDRLGRALACLSFALPLVLLFAVGSAAATGRWEWLPNILGSSLGTLFTGLGLASVVSARWTSAVPAPGESPFKKPPGNTAQTLLVQFAGMGVMAVLLLPEIAMVVTQAVTGQAAFSWIGLAAGPVFGVGFFVAGIRLGGRWLDRRGPEMFAQLADNR
ncbi:transporter [Arthrobacter cupressi]|uniref:ABC-2 type transport system permease protein n=1 Tax=Arthrobacter cupressi TaxID=1045773 RepID=A0A1G8U4C7_9MICC|nr:transporter [Arthrobacter cupressi]NYD76580.1 ABC-2 type transport system permease protein [Arthrobacter cupressi]SDJ48676.1 ABC-2 type transport system permease protein [Arthrobacter cupressi]